MQCWFVIYMAIVFLTLCAVLYIGSTLHLPNVQWAQMSPVYSSISNARSRCLCFKFNYIQTFSHAFSDKILMSVFPYWGNCRPTQPFPESTSLPCHRRRCPQLTHAQLVCKGRAAQALWIVELCCFFTYVFLNGQSMSVPACACIASESEAWVFMICFEDLLQNLGRSLLRSTCWFCLLESKKRSLHRQAGDTCLILFKVLQA